MGLAIIFCSMEIQYLQSLKGNIQEGTPYNENIKTIVNLFPSNYCAFELILFVRLLYFLLFNLICLVSIELIETDD